MSDINNANRYPFRGKRIDGQGWVEGSLIHEPVQSSNEFSIYVRGDRQRDGFNQPLVGVGKYRVDPSTVGQWTGANDKDGVKIFEGDIVRLHGKANYTISWNPDYCRFEFTNFGIFTTIALCAYRPDFYDKLGNIWDNPELLE